MGREVAVLVNKRGTYDLGCARMRASVGLTLFHTVGDRDRLVEQIDTEFGQLVAELFRKMGADPELLKLSTVTRDPVGWSKLYQAAEQTLKKSPIYPLWKDTVMPVWSEWKAFYNEQSSWEEWKTNWDTYENWRNRVAKLHAHVVAEVNRRMPGQPIRTPVPTEAPKTIWAEAEEVTAGGLKAVPKVVAYAGLAAVGALVVVRMVQSSLKGSR